MAVLSFHAAAESGLHLAVPAQWKSAAQREGIGGCSGSRWVISEPTRVGRGGLKNDVLLGAQRRGENTQWPPTAAPRPRLRHGDRLNAWIFGRRLAASLQSRACFMQC